MSAKAGSGLNVYKKVAIIRKADDVLSFEDAEGNVKTITDLHLAAAATTKIHKPKPKNDIPVPKIRDVETYKTDIPANYDCPIAFVRPAKLSHQEQKDHLEYVIDAEDEVWLINNAKFGKASQKSSEGADPKRTAEGEEKLPTQLPLDFFEIMLDALEKATGFETIITMDQFEHLILKKLPELYHMYPTKARAGVTTLKHVLTDIYSYWVSKRSKLKRPLLRRFWPVTSSDDTNPHLVFRPREKEKYKLRKKRQNDMDAYRKMEQLKQDFSHVRILCELVKKREEMNRTMVLLQKEWFRQKIHDAVDTSGNPRCPSHITAEQLDRARTVEKYFDVQLGWKKKSRRRGSQAGRDSASSSPTTDSMSDMPFDIGRGSMGASGGESRRPLSVAGHNHGEPAPNFLQPLDTREAFAVTWDKTEPHVPSYVDSNPVPTFRFRHRPRVGRGGRVCIDRMPLPADSNDTPTYFRAGGTVGQTGTILQDRTSQPLNRDAVRRRIQAISLDALKEDYETPPDGLPGQSIENDGEVVLVKMRDWLETDDQLWGEERFAIGPI